MARERDGLTADQRARADATAAAWCRVAACTDEAEWAEFERGARFLYQANALPWPDRIVRVSSPIVGALAAPIADWLLTRRRSRFPRNRAAVERVVRRTLHRRRVNEAAHQAVVTAVCQAIGLPVRPEAQAQAQARDEAGPVVVDPVTGEFEDAVSRTACLSVVVGAVLGLAGGFLLADDVFGFPLGWAIVFALVIGSLAGGIGALVVSSLWTGILAAVRGEAAFETGTMNHSWISPLHLQRFYLPKQTNEEVETLVRRPVETLCSALNEAVEEAVEAALSAAVRAGWADRSLPLARRMLGQWNVAEHARADFVQVLEPERTAEEDVQTFRKLVASAAPVGWWWPHRSFVLVVDRPRVLSLDPDGTPRLHREDGPAAVWPDGWSLWFVHGVRVTEQIVRAPESLRVDQITYQANAEVRRVMIDRYGTEKYLQAAHATRVQRDDFGELWRLRHGSEPLQFVKVVNSTPEPDGTFKDYWLRVPPEMRTAHEAVAWTFGFTAEEYRPQRQT